jgi:hypothetical protein
MSFKYLQANIFVRIHFKNKTKKWNSIFSEIGNPCQFQQDLSIKKWFSSQIRYRIS